MIIPLEKIDKKVLYSVIEEFATRDGTDSTDTKTKINEVEALLKSGEALLVFDEESMSCNIVKADAIDPESE